MNSEHNVVLPATRLGRLEAVQRRLGLVLELRALALELLALARVAVRQEAVRPVAQLPEAVVFDPSSRS